MSRKLVKKRGKKAGAPPGTLVHVGDRPGEDVRVRVIDYDQDHLDDNRLPVSGKIGELRDSRSVSWVHVDGVHQVDVIEQLGNQLGLHPLVMEDILNTDQRPKIEVYDDYLFIVLKLLTYDAASREVRAEQVSLVLGEHFVLSLQESSHPILDTVRERLKAGRRIRFLGPDYLAYAIIDAIVDNYFTVIESFADQIESLEDILLGTPSPSSLEQVHHMRREMLLLRKAIWPLREVLSSLSRNDLSLVTEGTRLFLRDVYDHIVHALDTVETLRDLLVGMLDLYLSSVSNRMNEVMKVLTIIATLFMPLTFIAGVYGMNFEYMPELSWPWAYPAVMLLMFAVLVMLVVFFRRKRWL